MAAEWPRDYGLRLQGDSPAVPAAPPAPAAAAEPAAATARSSAEQRLTEPVPTATLLAHVVRTRQRATGRRATASATAAATSSNGHAALAARRARAAVAGHDKRGGRTVLAAMDATGAAVAAAGSADGPAAAAVRNWRRSTLLHGHRVASPAPVTPPTSSATTTPPPAPATPPWVTTIDGEGDGGELAALPSDTLAAFHYLRSRFPRQPLPGPPVVIMHQLYTVVRQRTTADHDVVRALPMKPGLASCQD